MAKAKKTKINLNRSQLFTLELLIKGAVFENNEIIKNGSADLAENAEHRLADIKDLQGVIEEATGFKKVKEFTL